jgi:hypothetical protein
MHDLPHHSLLFECSAIFRILRHIGLQNSANACLQATQARPDRKYTACKTTQTLVAGTYAKTGERGWGRLQGFVSAFCGVKIHIFFALHLRNYATMRILLTSKRNVPLNGDICQVFNASMSIF